MKASTNHIKPYVSKRDRVESIKQTLISHQPRATGHQKHRENSLESLSCSGAGKSREISFLTWQQQLAEPLLFARYCWG
jgi:hypothetical protein